MWAASIPVIFVIRYLDRRQKRIDQKSAVTIEPGNDGASDIESKYASNEDLPKREVIAVLADQAISEQLSRV
ncbi:hypothetical protein L202_02602 [Cryptococcus amylolentus CBS 6039]|uniref:Uncharacterized protein n=2 Tax=Cryptococcus amylolentus TaxID=104669 RepID=A0A1E3HVJ7_9TREE|nr:hypothetical protein L202_02602 [Cryptococcus amylolentus CBS 6039]ODN80342.1 hypothetical protein L202_02602 [Cryptococcus amylolentus CBS 6039]ODO08985.1 hypothetical protein I350_02578 [Cryptococcus amylolentus CBS 6273]